MPDERIPEETRMQRQRSYFSGIVLIIQKSDFNNNLQFVSSENFVILIRTSLDKSTGVGSKTICSNSRSSSWRMHTEDHQRPWIV